MGTQTLKRANWAAACAATRVVRSKQQNRQVKQVGMLRRADVCAVSLLSHARNSGNIGVCERKLFRAALRTAPGVRGRRPWREQT